MTKPYFWMSLVRDDAELVAKAVNRGIDSRLEGVTSSRFQWTAARLNCVIGTIDDLQVIIRRLLEQETEEAEQLADDIVSAQFGVEVSS